MERDPVERVADDDVDLYEISSWEPRSRLDRLLVGTEDWVRIFYRYLVWVAAGLALASVIGLSALVLVAEFQFGTLDTVTDPVVTALVILSVVPALLIAAYIWRVDVTTGEPASLLVVTFLLTIVLAGAAALLNELGSAIINVVGAATLGAEFVGTPIMLILFFFLVVGPVEETVKLLAVRLYAYRDDRFDAVIDGAVYGAVAGLGFATIENALYITRPLESVMTTADVLQTAGGTTAARTLAGPGHVIYSALAGFYLGLAKFNREHAVPLIAKGLFLAAVIHATYNTGASIVPPWLVGTLSMSSLSAVVIYVVAFDIAAGYFLYLKLKRYQDTYRAVGADHPDRAPTPELVEFDGSTHTAPTSTGAVRVASNPPQTDQSQTEPRNDTPAEPTDGRGSVGSVDTGSTDGEDDSDDRSGTDSLDDWEF